MTNTSLPYLDIRAVCNRSRVTFISALYTCKLFTAFSHALARPVVCNNC